MKYNLSKERYLTTTAFDGEEGLKKALEENPDLILLDIMLPKMDGFEVCQKIRKQSNVPILMLTAKEDEVDKILGLELGADDYIKKPFSMRELLARIKTNIRRTNFMGLDDSLSVDKFEGKKEYTLGDITVDLQKIEIRKKGIPLELSLREYNLLKLFINNPNKVFSRTELLEKIWGYEYYGDIRAVDVSMRRVREKIEDNPSKPKYIHTKRGVGYYFSTE
ncbi:MAG: response regulator transcription factor [Clostridiales Family XIII bacterium]|nr:response regulator transcription factor [Clostridiales Family XIII bacterium]